LSKETQARTNRNNILEVNFMSDKNITEFMRGAALLINEALSNLPAEAHSPIDTALASGARVRLEVDFFSPKPCVIITMVELEGRRHELARLGIYQLPTMTH